MAIHRVFKSTKQSCVKIFSKLTVSGKPPYKNDQESKEWFCRRLSRNDFNFFLTISAFAALKRNPGLLFNVKASFENAFFAADTIEDVKSRACSVGKLRADSY